LRNQYKRFAFPGCASPETFPPHQRQPIVSSIHSTQNNPKMPDIDCIREQLSLYPGSKLGFVIYRLTYSDDAQWARFMSHLNTRIRLELEEDGNGDLFSHIDWDVQEDPELDDALYETVRE
jgi:hypothetical protein